MSVSSDWLWKAQLWLVLDRHAAHPRALHEVTECAIRGGVDAVLCRIKDLPQSDVRQLANQVRDVCYQYCTPFIMSHDIELAAELMADGLQLGVGDPDISQARSRLSQTAVIGYSTHSVAEALSRAGEGADYAFLGPVFPTPAKLKYGAPLGLGVVSQAVASVSAMPLVFIGGVNTMSMSDILSAGGQRVAAIAALQAVPDPEVAARTMKAQLANHPIS